MKYGITRRVLGCKQFIEVSAEAFEKTLRARTLFFQALGIEEKFDLVAENFMEFENELLQLTMRQTLFQDIGWGSLRNDIRTINRRLANLLSACRLYVDHAKHDVSSTYGKDSDLFARLCAAFSHEYDTRLGYCVLESLRNHMQHCGLPIASLMYSSALDFPGNVANHIKHICLPKISVSRLKEEDAFKQLVLDRLVGREDSLDIRPLVRDYVSGLGCVHLELRKWMTEDIAQWRGQLISIRDQFRREYGANDVGLAIVERDDQNRGVRWASIFDEFLDEYDTLKRKNAIPQHYAKQFVTNQAGQD